MFGMDRQHYLNLAVVKDFSAWLERKLDPPGAFRYRYYLVKAKQNWDCSCLYEAYESYWWPYNLKSKSTGNSIRGSSFKESFHILTALAGSFRRAVVNDDATRTIKYAEVMLAWGGVLNSNRERVNGMADKAPAYFKRACELLNLEHVTLGGHKQVYINSGFTKLFVLVNKASNKEY